MWQRCVVGFKIHMLLLRKVNRLNRFIYLILIIFFTELVENPQLLYAQLAVRLDWRKYLSKITMHILELNF